MLTLVILAEISVEAPAVSCAFEANISAAASSSLLVAFTVRINSLCATRNFSIEASISPISSLDVTSISNDKSIVPSSRKIELKIFKVFFVGLTTIIPNNTITIIVIKINDKITEIKTFLEI